MRVRVINVGKGADNCPADVLMADFRKALNENAYAKNIEFSSSCIAFFKEMADVFEETEDDIHVCYGIIEEENLPALEIKIRKKGGRYYLNFLKEYGEEETTHIQGKSRKGRNKGVQESIYINKVGPAYKKDKGQSEEEPEV